MIHATETDLATVTDKTIIIPGYGPEATNPSSLNIVTCWWLFGKMSLRSRSREVTSDTVKIYFPERKREIAAFFKANSDEVDAPEAMP